MEQPEAAPAPDLAALAAQFGLTPADAAAMLDIANTTAKAHLARLFAKTGTAGRRR